MTIHIGRLIKLGLGKETSRGAVIAPTYWLPILKANHGDKAGYAMNEATYGTIVDNVGGEVVKRNGEGGFDAYIGDKHFGLILYALFGSLSTGGHGGTGNGSVYDHVFTLAESAQHQSLTVSIDEPNGDFQYPLGMLSGLEMKFELGKLLEYSASFRSKKGVSGSVSASLPTDNIFRPHDFHFYLADTYGGLGGASEIPVKSFNLTFEPEVEDYDVLGNQEPNEILNKQFKISGSATLIWDVETYKNMHLNGTTKALRVKLQDTGVTIGSGLNPTLTIDLAKVVFPAFSKDTALGEVVMQTIEFTAGYSTADTTVGQAVLVNLVTSY